jgi:hypothetical protein
VLKYFYLLILLKDKDIPIRLYEIIPPPAVFAVSEFQPVLIGSESVSGGLPSFAE